MRLIVSEKPSVAYAIGAALGVGQKRKGYLEGNGYLISWCFGHLAALADADQYDPKYKKWRKEDLLIVPATFQFCISEEKRSQFELLKNLMRRQDVSEVINACDAGREGELIFRTVYELAQCRKPMKRLWISSMEDEAIREGFENLCPGEDFDGLYQSALCRAKADWLVGINATRFFSLVYGTKLNVGRVMSPTLALMVQREAQIQAFVPERFYTVNLDCGFSAASDRIQDFTDATKIADVCKGAAAIVKSVERREKTENAPLLYDLTTLQRNANRLLGFTAQQTLDYLQSLYEKKLCTYPRTDSRYLTDDMFLTLGSLTRTAASILGCLPPDMADAQRVCDSRKVSDHHAIVPTQSSGTLDITALPVPEQHKVDKEKLDPDTKLPMLDDEGKPITEEKEVTIPMFKVVSVFDVAQTEGKPLPQISFSLTGDVAQYEVFMEALRRTSQVPITIEPMEPGMDGYFSLTKQEIFLREGMSQVQTVCAAIHEMAHSRLHNYEKMTELADDGETVLAPEEKDRNTEEVEAESISYAVCQYFGIETADNGFGYIATWSQGKELKELRASLETINKTSSELISGIEQHYREICKERGIDLTADTPVQEQPQVPEPMEQALDEYPMPDETLKMADLEACGYMDGDMLPLSKERAAELFRQELTIYTIVDGGNAEMLFDREELKAQAPGTVFAVSREEWEYSPMFHDKIEERQQHQEERENAFLRYSGDCFAIYQVKMDDPGNVRFMNMDWMQSHGKAIERGSYDLIYTTPLTATGSTDAKLEAIYEQFNLHRPADYHSPSLSVSDIVAIKQSGVVSYYYCDSVGFKELPDFWQENYLKAAEKKPSVLEKLKGQSQQPQRKPKAKISKEKEL